MVFRYRVLILRFWLKPADVESPYFLLSASFKLYDYDCVDEGYLALDLVIEGVDWKKVCIIDDKLVGVDYFADYSHAVY